ncbi:ferredoxin [Agromyces rhizosphaerae]|uniref:Ferredoxin n=1 Tax=Agromyces rhizosphaerae TaxID=88374 RepID=A0A9W6CTE5_9MICO|nr:FAD-dependent oxidoreductase [Agromyces rhizosphaerae]GLI28153.1 ferredoxin [Agromyces rhizosphaerae]
MASTGRVIIVGGGLAAARAAGAAREAGHDDELVLVAGEPLLPHERPPLSKGYLQGSDAADVIFPHDAAWYAGHDVDVRTGSEAVGLDTDARELTLASGERLAYRRVLVATGARARRFTGPGAGLDGVHHLRTLAESTALRDAISGGDRRVAVVGAGWIGLEVAAAARSYGNEVTVLGHGEVPLAREIGPELGAVFQSLHREHGVDLRMGADVVGVRGDGAASAVVLGSGEEVPADVVVFGIGAVPNVELAASAGLAVDDGVTVDAHLAASAPGVFAAGDVASIFSPTLGTHLRVAHWGNADASGTAAGRALAGERVTYDEIPYFFTDQYDLGMEYSGYGSLAEGAELVVRGDLAAREFVAFRVAGGRVVAGMNVNVWDVNDQVQRLIRSGAVVDPAALADADVPLEGIAA